MKKKVEETTGVTASHTVIGASHSFSTPHISDGLYDGKVPGLNFSPRNAPEGPVRSFSYSPAGKAEMPVLLLQWGNVAIAGVQPELSASTGAQPRFMNTHLSSPWPTAQQNTCPTKRATIGSPVKHVAHLLPATAETAAEFIVSQLKAMKEIQS